MTAHEVLVVDDDRSSRQLLGFQLDGQPWTLRHARNGRKALEQCREHWPAVILLDLHMPAMDGFAFLTALRAEPSQQDVAVVVLTAMDLTARQRERLSQSGVRRVFSKGSYSADDLLTEVRALLESRCPQS